MNKKLRTLLCALLILPLLLSFLPLSRAAGSDGGAEREVFHIRTAEDLAELAALCSLDTWSDGLQVVLDRDLSLSGAALSPIPIFNGSFDGRGHSLYDLELTAAQSPCGLFLETGSEAVIRGLNVTGTVAPSGEDGMAGGIVGLNRGTIASCSFSGQVAAVSQVGGIAGKNEATGLISDCRSSGTVSGLDAAGGIVGLNEGAVRRCESSCYVNIESVDPALRLDAIDTSSLLNLLQSFRTDAAGITTDTGGIAGYNKGFLTDCVNSGTVGYLHLGCRVGGVAGRSGGYISNCSNSGEVYGRLSVGGVVGQLEPLVEVSQARDLIASLGGCMAALNASLNTAIEDASQYSDELAAQLSVLPGYLAPVAQASAGADPGDPDSLAALSGSISNAAAGMSAEMNAITEGLGEGSELILADLQEVSDDLEALSGTAMQIVSLLSGAEETENVLDDNSADAAAEAVTLGKLRGCLNEGSVYGDSKVGGIAGAISLDDDAAPDADLRKQKNVLVQKHYQLSAVILESVNRGEVTAKRECAGGICGRMDLGFAADCASYGTVALEDGDYAGGVCGLCYGRVERCWVKCALEGKKYVGGVLGNGYDGSGDEERASKVSGCYALTEIRGEPQFAGAISGGGEGLYEENYFVPAGYAGLDRLSIHGRAEPIDFEDFARTEGLPEACTRFTLRFVVEGETVKTLDFAYGDSFDRSVFPAVGKKNDAYAVWDRTDLSDLRFDTVVTASYRTDETVLRSALTRGDGRAVVYVEGQFQSGDELTLEQLPVAEDALDAFRENWLQTIRRQLRSIFRERQPDYSLCRSVAEQLRLSFPDDGLAEHRLRYLTPDGGCENYRIYLRDGDGWQRLTPGLFGSYYTVTIPGTEAELALVSTIQSWWIVAYIAGALLVLALLVLAGLRLSRRLRARPPRAARPRGRLKAFLRAHKKSVRLGAVCAAAAALIAGIVLLSTDAGNALACRRILRSFAAEETDILTDVGVELDDRTLSLSTTIHRVRDSGRMVSCAEAYGLSLYVSDGKVFLENGRAFRLTGSELDHSTAAELAGKIFRSGSIEKLRLPEGICYEAQAEGETADRLLRFFLSGAYDGLLHTEDLKVRLYTGGGELQRLSITGSGRTESGTAFVVDAQLRPQQMTLRPVIPQAVREAIALGGEAKEVFSADLLVLLAVWMKNDAAPAVDADLSLNADCGALKLNADFDYFRKTVDGREIHCVSSPLLRVYFTDEAACTEQGAPLTAAEEKLPDAAGLIPIARELCLRGRYACENVAERRTYTISLSPEDAAKIARELLPELGALSVDYDDCTLVILVRDGELNALELRCGGTMKVVAREVETSLALSVRFRRPTAHEIPEAVRAALLEN